MGQPGDFHHVLLEVADLDRAEQFFQDALGFESMGRNQWPEEAPNVAFRTSERQYLILVEVPEVKPEGPGVHTNFILSPTDYDVVYGRLRDRGALVVDHRAEQRSVGEVSTYFSDPDGHHLQITAFAPEAFLVPPARRGKVVAGRIDDFSIGSVTHIKEGKFFLVRLREGILAISEVCTHHQCTVTYQPEHYRFYCPCHYRKFSRTGLQLAVESDTPPLHVYPVEFVDGQIVVDTDRSIPRAPEQTDRMVAIPDAVDSRAGA